MRKRLRRRVSELCWSVNGFQRCEWQTENDIDIEMSRVNTWYCRYCDEILAIQQSKCKHIRFPRI